MTHIVENDPGREALRPIMRRLAGSVVLVNLLNGYKDDHNIEITLDPPARFAVDRAVDNDSNYSSVDHYLDTYLDIAPLDASDSRLQGFTSFYTFGPSFDYNEGAVSESRDYVETGERAPLPNFINFEEA